MTQSSIPEPSRMNRPGEGRRWRRRSVFAASVGPLLGILLLGGPMISSAQTDDESTNGASASPSDRPVVADEPAPPSAEAAAPSTCKPRTCKPRTRKCRKPRAKIRLPRRSRRACKCCSASATDDEYAWKDLFDGKTLDGWKTPEFGGEGEVYVKDGRIMLEMGSTMTGITWTGEVLRDNYELQYEAARWDGIDFFATATFPVGKECCSLVTGGWGGTVVGLSIVDFYDASDNMTTTFQEFKDKQWYTIRIRVTPAKIEAWLDDQQVVDQKREGHKIGIRDEVDLCQPLGISSWVTTGAVRKIRVRKLKPEEG